MSMSKTILAIVIGLIIAISSADAEPDAPRIEDYGRLPAFEIAAISPSGSRIAIIAQTPNGRALIIFQDNTQLKGLALGDVKVRDLEWANNDLVLLDFSQTEKLAGFTVDQTEFFRTILVPVGAQQERMLFTNERQIADATFGRYGVRQIGGRSYGFFGGIALEKSGRSATNAKTRYTFAGGWPELYRVDLDTMEAEKVSGPSADAFSTWIVDDKGMVAATLRVDDRSGKWNILGADSKAIASGINAEGGISLLAIGPGGQTLFYRRENEASGIIQFWEVPLGGGEPQERFAGIDIARFILDPTTKRLAGYLTDDMAQGAFFFDPKLSANFAKLQKTFGSLRLSQIDVTSGFEKVVLRTDGNGDSGSWWHVDLVNLRAVSLGFERPNIPSSAVGLIKTIRYAAADGLEIDAILTLPPNRPAKNLPVILLPHGGPTSHDIAGFDWWAQAFAARGYAVLQPNFRGSTNRDAAFVQAGYGEWGRKMQTDISDGLTHLASEGIVDPSRACIVGASYGGYAALAGVTVQNGVYRCAVSVNGIANLPQLTRTEVRESGNNAILKRNIAKEIGIGRKLEEVSPWHLARRADAPILLIHGKDDIVVPYSQSLNMADALKDAGKPHQLVSLAGEDHWLSRSETRLEMLTAAIEFVDKHNPSQ
jgi:dipeptidyl aminopeptidase/acylaminoacyl peptidase